MSKKINQFMLVTSKMTSAQVAEMLVWYSHLDDYNSTFFRYSKRKHSIAYSALPCDTDKKKIYF